MKEALLALVSGNRKPQRDALKLTKESEERKGERAVLWEDLQLASSKEHSSLSLPPNKTRTIL